MAKIDFKDDILNASMDGKRQYTLINNPNGTVSLNDVTVYDQLGDDFGAKEANDIGKDINLVSLVQIAGGTATAITLGNVSLVNGLIITFVVAANNNGAATTINGKSLYKPSTTQTPTLTAGKAVTVWYNGTHFFIKASAEGNAVAGDVLAGKTFSNDDDTGIEGIMVNNGPSTAETINLTNNNQEYSIPKGFHSGLKKIKAAITGLVASVIKAGVSVGGVVGTFTSDATAAANFIIEGKTAYVKGNKVTGNIPIIYPDFYDSIPTAVPASVFEGWGDRYAIMKVPTNKFYEGINWVRSYQPDLVPANILQGKSIFGVAGSALGLKVAQGTAYPTVGYISVTHQFGGNSSTFYGLTISGLAFKPFAILVFGVAQEHITMYLENELGATAGTPNPAKLFTLINGTYYAVSSWSPGITNNGFTVPVYSSESRQYKWIAYGK